MSIIIYANVDLDKIFLAHAKSHKIDTNTSILSTFIPGAYEIANIRELIKEESVVNVIIEGDK